MKQIIGKSTTKHYLLMIFYFQSCMVSPHPCRISWKIIKRIIFSWPMKVGGTSYPQSRSKITEKGQQPKSRRLLLLERHIIMTATYLLESWGRRSQGMVSCSATKDPTTRCISITVPIAIVWFAKSQECLRNIICIIVLRNVFTSVPTTIPSRMQWEDL